MTIYYIILALVIILLILTLPTAIFLAACIYEEKQSKHVDHEIKPEYKGLHDKFVGRK